jgi:hypothetical protein
MPMATQETGNAAIPYVIMLPEFMTAQKLQQKLIVQMDWITIVMATLMQQIAIVR